MASRRARERGDKHDRWEFQHWSEERDQDEEELPDQDDDPPPSNTFH